MNAAATIKVYADGDDINPDTYTLAFKKFKNTLELSEITVNGRKAKQNPNNIRKFTIDVMGLFRKYDFTCSCKMVCI